MNQLIPATDRAAGKSSSISQSVNQSISPRFTGPYCSVPLRRYWLFMLSIRKDICKFFGLQALAFEVFLNKRMLFSPGRLPFQSITLMPVLFSAALLWLFPLTIFSGLLFNQNLQEIKRGLRNGLNYLSSRRSSRTWKEIKWWALPICSECMEYLPKKFTIHLS